MFGFDIFVLVVVFLLLCLAIKFFKRGKKQVISDDR